MNNTDPRSDPSDRDPVLVDGGLVVRQASASYSDYYDQNKNINSGRREPNTQRTHSFWSGYNNETDRINMINVQYNLYVEVPNAHSMDKEDHSPNEEIQASLNHLEKGETIYGTRIPQLALLPSCAQLTKEKFGVISNTSPNQLSRIVRSPDAMRDYILQYSHPAAQHNRKAIGYHNAHIKRMGMSITNHESMLQNLYNGINNTFTEVNNQLGELSSNHNAVARRLVYFEERLESFLTEYMNYHLNQIGIDQEWAKYVTSHVDKTETFLQKLCEEINRNSSLTNDVTFLKDKESKHDANISLLQNELLDTSKYQRSQSDQISELHHMVEDNTSGMEMLTRLQSSMEDQLHALRQEVESLSIQLEASKEKERTRESQYLKLKEKSKDTYEYCKELDTLLMKTV